MEHTATLPPQVSSPARFFKDMQHISWTDTSQTHDLSLLVYVVCKVF